MQLERQKEFVEAFHYDAYNGDQVENEIRVEINPLDTSDQEDFNSEENCALGIRVIYKIVFPEFTLTGAVRQLVTVVGRIVTKPEELTKDEVNELVNPLFSLIERLTYEVTEIALDRPGLKLNFQNEDEAK